MDFVSFHTHTTYSYADGYGTVEQHVKRVAELGMSALGLSEHGNPNSHPALERYSKEYNIKPIFGLESYFGPVGDKRTRSKTHLGIFAKDQEGYANLNKIITQSYIDTFNKWPTVSPTVLKRYNNGLIVFSGCSDSLISCSLLGGKFLGPKRDPDYLGGAEFDEALSKTNRRIQWFLDVFGPERFFLEVQRFPNLERTCALNETFAKLGEQHGISLVATADVHYPRSADNRIQAILHASRWRGTQNEFASEQSWELTAKLTYPESDKEIEDDLVATGLSQVQARKAIEQTAKLAEICTVELPKAKALKFRTQENRSALDELKHRIKQGWKVRCGQRASLLGEQKRYNQRLVHELKVIAEKDFCDYFLCVADLVTWAKQPSQDITVGPGRGSAAGSLVCYVLGITEIDPLHPTFERMIFERFIDKSRSDMPDVDLDFDDEKRWMIPERARELYGKENVCNVANHNKYRGKSALAGVATAYGLPRNFFDEIGKRIPDRVETDERVDDAIEDVLTNYRNNPKIAALVDEHGDKIQEAILLEGNEYGMGIHAGGFIIASDPVPDVCAILAKTKGTGRNIENVQVIPYEKRDAEYLNLLKMDFLGLTTMGQVGLCRKWTGMSLDDLYSMYYKQYDEWVKANERKSFRGNVYDRILNLFQSDDLTGIFQYEGGTTRQVTKDVKPDNFDELAACNALSRPGPLYGGQTSKYIKVKNGEEDWERIHPTGFDRHVEWTYGQIVYQEQIMWILRDLANFSVERVLKVRKIIGKKLGEFQFARLWQEFLEGCISNGVSEENAARVWSAITTAAGYAFNTSHAYSYALIAWWQGFLKIHHKTEFFASQLAKNGDGKDDNSRRIKLIEDAEYHGVLVSDFDPSGMGVSWEPDWMRRGYIMPGFSQMPNVGINTSEDIVQFRMSWQGEFKWWNLAQVKGVGETTIMKMVEFSAKEDPFDVHKTGKQLQLFREQLHGGEFDGTGLPESEQYVGGGDGPIPDENNWVAWVGLVSNIHFKDEIESIRVRTGKSVEEIKAEMDEPEKSTKASVYCYDETGEVSLRVSRWVYPNLATKLERIRENHHLVVAWGRTFAGRPNSIQLRNLWIMEPE